MTVSGLKVSLGVAVTDLTIPIVRADPILTSGSLLLVDPSHGASPWAAGVPVNGATIPNLAQSLATQTIGSAPGLPEIYNVGMTGAKGKVERTPRGGVAAIASQATASGATDLDSFNIAVPKVTWDFMRTSGHAFYVSVWHRKTRVATNANTTITALQTDASFLMLLRQASTTSSGTVSGASSATNTLGLQRRSAAATARAGFGTEANTLETTSIPQSRSIFIVGNRATQNRGVGVTLRATSSEVFYRAYVEDLTVSGRSYTDVDAIDAALYASAFSGAGRYAGDSVPTDPATIP